MPSDNETDSGSSGNGGRAQQRQLQRPAPPLASTSTGRYNPGESRSKHNRRRGGYQQRHAKKWTDEDLLAMLPLSLEEGSGAEYLVYGPSFQGPGRVESLMLKNFRPPTFLEYQQKHGRGS
ncbi:hypothetical protein BV898_14120 [Hypsibius exemplaris]|uniref:Uncharacterized protein n=1 Tax=Hypsibius exemplaris TaxID=2072580 RepID=A0A1W0W8N2_HYPEX|nr:hypothetical protein BV898_14120 [Hypsibius exemplaris]